MLYSGGITRPSVSLAIPRRAPQGASGVAYKDAPLPCARVRRKAGPIMLRRIPAIS